MNWRENEQVLTEYRKPNTENQTLNTEEEYESTADQPPRQVHHCSQ